MDVISENNRLLLPGENRKILDIPIDENPIEYVEQYFHYMLIYMWENLCLFYMFTAIGLILVINDIHQVINYYKATRDGQQIIMSATQQEAPAIKVVLQDELPLHPDLSEKLKSAKDL